MFKTLRSFVKDQHGYGVIELMVIMAALGALAGVIFTTLKGDSSSGLTKSAGDVTAKVDTQISNW
jgi:Flp pilus assembly pilin Flp